MIENIEKECYDYICERWVQFSKQTKAIHKSPQHLVRTYDSVSQAVNQFLQDKLKILESEKNETR
jgi:hypothetical protein